MRSRTDVLLAGAIVLAVAGCGVDAPTPSPTPEVDPSPAASPVSTRTAAPSPSPTTAFDLPEPGRPWDAATVLREMGRSTRPDGVPDELRTDPIAAAVADTIWTVDGSAWDTFAIGGFCGTARCTLEVAGTHLGRGGEDLWVLEIDPSAARVTVVETSLRSLPQKLVRKLETLARHHGDLPDDMSLATASWMPPPAAASRFTMSFRTGGEEGSCAVDLVLDAREGSVVERRATGC